MTFCVYLPCWRAVYCPLPFCTFVLPHPTPFPRVVVVTLPTRLLALITPAHSVVRYYLYVVPCGVAFPVYVAIVFAFVDWLVDCWLVAVIGCWFAVRFVCLRFACLYVFPLRAFARRCVLPPAQLLPGYVRCRIWIRVVPRVYLPTLRFVIALRAFAVPAFVLARGCCGSSLTFVLPHRTHRLLHAHVCYTAHTLLLPCYFTFLYVVVHSPVRLFCLPAPHTFTRITHWLPLPRSCYSPVTFVTLLTRVLTVYCWLLLVWLFTPPRHYPLQPVTHVIAHS